MIDAGARWFRAGLSPAPAAIPSLRPIRADEYSPGFALRSDPKRLNSTIAGMGSWADRSWIKPGAESPESVMSEDGSHRRQRDHVLRCLSPHPLASPAGICAYLLHTNLYPQPRRCAEKIAFICPAQLESARPSGTINLRHQSLYDGRAWRHFAHLNASSIKRCR